MSDRGRKAVGPCVGAALVMVFLMLGRSAAYPEAGACRVTPVTDPPRDVILCDGGLTIVAERSAKYRLLDSDGNGRPEGAELDRGGLLIEGPPSDGRQFQVLTPHAIAAVRGTVWAVDVEPGRTSVFVSRGVVAVTAGGDAPKVELKEGDGVDVQPGLGYKAKHWPEQRVSRLLARFGR